MIRLYYNSLCSCLSFSPGGQHGHVQPFSDEDASIETLSHCSSFSDTASVADEGRPFVYTSVMQLHVLHVLQSLFKHVSMRAGYDPSGCLCTFHAKCGSSNILCPVPHINTVRHVRQVSIYTTLLCCQVERPVRTQPRRTSSTS